MVDHRVNRLAARESINLKSNKPPTVTDGVLAIDTLVRRSFDLASNCDQFQKCVAETGQTDSKLLRLMSSPDPQPLAVVIAMLILVSGCASTSVQRDPLPEILTVANGGDEEIVQRVLKRVPVGTPMDSAKQILIDAGLRCSVERDSQTGEQYLLCGYSDQIDTWVTWVYTIHITCDDGVVSHVSCNQHGIGP